MEILERFAMERFELRASPKIKNLTPENSELLERLNLIYRDSVGSLQFMHKSFFEYFVAKNLARQRTLTNEFFYANRAIDDNPLSRLKPLQPEVANFLLTMLPDDTKIDLMKEDGIYSAYRLRLSDIN